MDISTSVDELRTRTRAWREAGERIAFVPTMGNLHDGHLELVRRAAGYADRVIVSIFVNPLQFSPGEDFENYPRTPDEDEAALASCGVDVLFAPDFSTLYPHGLENETRVSVPDLCDDLCGRNRPGHFTGVATVVAKLFNLVQPDVALFGEKDFQQLLVIRRMAADLCFPIEIIGIPTVREADGLAMSSRNRYLSASERPQARHLYEILSDVVDRARQGRQSHQEIEAAAIVALDHAGFMPDYVSIRRADNLAVAIAGDHDLVVLAAARLGQARLIDNIVFHVADSDELTVG